MSKSLFNQVVIRAEFDGNKLIDLKERIDVTSKPYSHIKRIRQQYFALDYTLLDFSSAATYDGLPIVEIMAHGMVNLRTLTVRYLLVITTRVE